MRRELVIGYTVRRYEQLDTFPETIEQELPHAVCDTDIFKWNYSIDNVSNNNKRYIVNMFIKWLHTLKRWDHYNRER